MRPISILLVGQALLCLLEAYLISKVSLIGRIGIALVHTEYQLLRSGWKTFLLLFGVQTILIVMLMAAEKKRLRTVARTVTLVCLLFAVAGLVATFIDFQYTYSHRLLKERFHLGFYLFWFGWMASCVFFLVRLANKKTVEPPKAAAEKGAWPEDKNREDTRNISLH